MLISTWLASTFTSVIAFFLLLRLGQYLDGRTGIEPGEFTRPALLLAFFLGFLEIYLHFCGRAAAWHLAQHRRQQVDLNDVVIGGWDISDMNLGDAMKLALFFVGGRKRRRVQRYAPP